MAGSQEAAPARPLRLVLVDDQAMFREGLRGILAAEPDLEVVADVSSVEEVAGEADVVVTDLVVRDLRGPAVVRALAERLPSAAIFVLTAVDNPSDVRLALAAGARGYMLKDSPSAELVEALRRVGAGEVFLQPSIGYAIAALRRPSGGIRADALAALSSRELEVLRLIALGHTNPEIAQMLHLSLRTVETHRANIQGKLGLRTRAELTRYAAEHGLAEPA
jgi:two-component system response regulator NreC